MTTQGPLAPQLFSPAATPSHTLNLNYGGADSCIALATGSVRALLNRLEKDGKTESQTPSAKE
jgi:hypothetical protein